MSAKIEQYYAHRVKNIFNHLHNFEIEITETSIHDFRVEIKKTKALIKFLRSIYGKQETKKLKQLIDALFQEAGDSREMQLIQNWLTENHLTEIQTKYFPPANIRIALNSFSKKLPEFKLKLDKALPDCLKILEKTNQITVEQYVLKLRHTIEKKIQKKITEDELHEFRKLLKQWMYSLNWVSEKEKTKTNYLFSYCNKLQESIGVWHDNLIIQKNLLEKKIHLAKEIEVQREYVFALQKLHQSLKSAELDIKHQIKNYQRTEIT